MSSRFWTAQVCTIHNSIGFIVRFFFSFNGETRSQPECISVVNDRVTVTLRRRRVIMRMELKGEEQQVSLHHMLAADTYRLMLVIVMILMVKSVLCDLLKTSGLRRCLLLLIR